MIAVDAVHCYDDVVEAYHLVDRSCSMQFHSLVLCLRHRRIFAMATKKNSIYVVVLRCSDCDEFVKFLPFVESFEDIAD